MAIRKKRKARFSISVPSKGRSWVSNTLRWLRTIPSDIPVYVYVDGREFEAYSKMYPGYIVVPHSEANIMRIRGFVQDHQYSLGMNTLMLDDDFATLKYATSDDVHKLWDVSITDFVLEVRELFERGNDFIYGYNWWCPQHYHAFLNPEHETWLTKNWRPAAVAAVGLGLRLYEEGIRYTLSDNVSEDVFMTIETSLAEYAGRIKTGVFTAMLDHRSGNGHVDNKSNFDKEFHFNGCVENYIKYGNVVDTYILPDESCWTQVNNVGVELHHRFGIVYTPRYDAILQSIKEHKLLGHKMIEKYDWSPCAEYKTEALKIREERRATRNDFLESFGAQDLFHGKLARLLRRGDGGAENITFSLPPTKEGR